MLRKAKPDEIPMELLNPKEAQAEAAAVPDGAVTADMLNQLIRERPGNVGAALRNWMATSNN